MEEGCILIAQQSPEKREDFALYQHAQRLYKHSFLFYEKSKATIGTRLKSITRKRRPQRRHTWQNNNLAAAPLCRNFIDNNFISTTTAICSCFQQVWLKLETALCKFLGTCIEVILVFFLKDVKSCSTYGYTVLLSFLQNTKGWGWGKGQIINQMNFMNCFIICVKFIKIPDPVFPRIKNI